ncbi:hypothetical protein H2199_009217 [Coniosporium tulheliwenetii]|uniref:Uncharacterized protein n=1 Tax=Coniosporium tulheliwenetii TaxID=3383036 RepID=A0ACC2YF53_9PEZI|nr:hypothetical protein H2199_009217 [Cladosporium sp. JES 115]
MSSSDQPAPARTPDDNTTSTTTPSRTSTRKPKPKLPHGYTGIVDFAKEADPKTPANPIVGSKRKPPTEGKRRGRPTKVSRINNGATGFSPINSGASLATPTPDLTHDRPAGNSAEQTASSIASTGTSDPSLPVSDRDPTELVHGDKGGSPVEQVAENTSNTIQISITSPTSITTQRQETQDGSSTRDSVVTTRPSSSLAAHSSTGKSVEPTNIDSPGDHYTRTKSARYESPYVGQGRDGQSRHSAPAPMTPRSRDANGALSAYRKSNGAVEAVVSTHQIRQRPIYPNVEGEQRNSDSSDNAQPLVQHSSGSLSNDSAVQQLTAIVASPQRNEQLQLGKASPNSPFPGSDQRDLNGHAGHPPVAAHPTPVDEGLRDGRLANTVEQMDDVNNVVASDSGSLSHPDSVDDDKAKKLGFMVLKHRRYRQMLSDVQGKITQHEARVHESEETISLEERALQQLEQQIHLLRAEMERKRSCVDGLRKSLESEVILVRTATSQKETLKRQMSEIKARLDLE